jgi:arylsulfatase
VLNGIQQKPIEGTSFLGSLFDPKAPESRPTQYFELLVNRGIYHQGWLASSRSFVPWVPVRGEFDPLTARWELYNLDEDFTQSNDIAAQHPEKLRELESIFWKEAEKYNVLPLDWRAVERLSAELQGRPRLAGKRRQFVYFPGQVALPDGASPPMLNKSWTITADVEITAGGAEGMIYTHGGLTGGLGLYLREGRAHFSYNMLAIDRYLVSSEKLPAGKVALQVRYDHEGQPGQLGKGGSVTLLANGQKVGEGKLPKTVPLQFSLGEGVDVGRDSGSAVDDSYRLPFAFTGKIDKVTIELK